MDQQLTKIELYPEPFLDNGLRLRIFWDEENKAWVEQRAIGRFPTDEDPRNTFPLSDPAYETLLTLFCLEDFRHRLSRARLAKMSPDELQNYPGKKLHKPIFRHLQVVKVDPVVRELEQNLAQVVEHE